MSFRSEVTTTLTDSLSLSFTPGTTALPKMVLHTNGSHPVGHLSTTHWEGVKEGDGHLDTGHPVKVGSTGRPAPGSRMELLDPDGRESDEAGVTVHLEPRPLGLMIGHADDLARTRTVMSGGGHGTGDTASRDQEGDLWFVGRADDVFESSDYRISPFAMESALVECKAVAEAAVVPSPDPIRGTIPKANVMLAPGFEPSAETARTIGDERKGRGTPFRRVRRIEFVPDLPKTVSGMTRRAQLRSQEMNREVKGPLEFSGES